MSKKDFNGSNLVKSYRVMPSDGPMVIDTNSLIEEKLERIRMVLPKETFEAVSFTDSSEQEFEDGLDVAMLDALTSDGYETEYDEEGNPVSNVIKAAPVMQEPVYDGPSPEELIAQAREEIELMRQNAAAEIEEAKSAGYSEGMNQGYADGRKSAEAEMSRAWKQISDAQANLEAERAELMAEIEPRFIKVLTAIYEKVFDTDLSGEQSIIVNLLHNTLDQIPGCKNYLIHVSRDDHEYVMQHKNELITYSMPEDVTIDIVEDLTMKAGDCMIETSGGIYDCGIGTQLEGLRKKLELLSFTP